MLLNPNRVPKIPFFLGKKTKKNKMLGLGVCKNLMGFAKIPILESLQF
jgi:hypothetical protein